MGAHGRCRSAAPNHLVDSHNVNLDALTPVRPTAKRLPDTGAYSTKTPAGHVDTVDCFDMSLAAPSFVLDSGWQSI